MVILRFLTSGNSYTAEQGSLDEKTTLSNIETGTIYIEYDTYKYWWWNGSAWVYGASS